ncbi:MAG: tetratricopeptide repeat protein, partial [Bifidobacteriaceae bacterium]|nr:tetratricopeptide repeat protein [Bifidobacteriaceae bacterium]
MTDSRAVPAERAPSVELDAAWGDLRWHVEATDGLPSVVFIEVVTPGHAETLRSRLADLARESAWRFTDCATEGFADWAWDNLPHPGILWISLVSADEDAVRRALGALNTLRGRLHVPPSGCLVVVGKEDVTRLAAREYGDIWSVRSFAVRVAPTITAPAESSLETRMELAPPSPPARWKAPQLTVPAEYRTSATRAVLLHLGSVYRQLPGNPEAARFHLANAADELRQLGQPDPVSSVLVSLAGAMLAAAQDDQGAVEQALDQAVASGDSIPDDELALRLLNEAADFGERFASSEPARSAARAATMRAETLDRRQGTAESARNLIRALGQAGDLDMAAGNLTDASDRFSAALDIAERLAGADPRNTGWQRDLSVSHERLGDVAVAVGDLAGARTHFAASLDIRERLAGADPRNTGW